MIDTIDDTYMGTIIVPIKVRLGVKAFSATILNFNSDDIDDYEEIVCTLYRNGSYSFAQKKLDLDLKNKFTPPARPSIEEPPVLEFNTPLLNYDMHF